MTNNTSTDVTLRGAWWNRVAAKHEDSHSTTPVDKQMNKDLSNHSRKTRKRQLDLLNFIWRKSGGYEGVSKYECCRGIVSILVNSLYI